MTEPEKSHQDISIPSQERKQPLPDTDAVNFVHSSSPTNLLFRLGLASSSLRSNPLEALKQKSWQTRVLALQALADLESEVPVSLIGACLQDPHEAVRMAAVRALGKRWKLEEVPLELFLLALGDKHVEVRATTVKVLETLGSGALVDPVIRHLIGILRQRLPAESRRTEELENLQSSDPHADPHEEVIVCSAIIHLLGTLGENAPLDELADALSDPDWQIREAAVAALGNLGDRVPLTLLTNALYDVHRFVRDAAIAALGRRLPMEVLLRNLFVPDPALRVKTAELLGVVGEQTRQQPVVEALLRSALYDKLPSVRQASLLALGQIGMPIPAVVIQRLLQDPDSDVREIAKPVLSALHPDYFDEEGNLNPGSLNPASQGGELIDYAGMNERTTEQSLERSVPASQGSPQSGVEGIDYTGRRIGNYSLRALLARGGQATVYLGEHVHLHTQVAVKVLNRHLFDRDVRHFLEEARTIASLKHPTIVRVLDCNVVDGIAYIAMDYLWRGTLRNVLISGVQLHIRVVAVYIKQLASALDYAHSRGVIHLDIKPENILLGENNTVLLSDFGIARRINSANWFQETTAGTLTYAAPEQRAGRPVKASDQYALAIVVYELLVGSVPFEHRHLESSKEFPGYLVRRMHNKNPQVSRSIEKVILQALADQPENRFPSVQAFADALEKACFPIRGKKIFGFFHRTDGA